MKNDEFKEKFLSMLDEEIVASKLESLVVRLLEQKQSFVNRKEKTSSSVCNFFGYGEEKKLKQEFEELKEQNSILMKENDKLKKEQKSKLDENAYLNENLLITKNKLKEALGKIEYMQGKLHELEQHNILLEKKNSETGKMLREAEERIEIFSHNIESINQQKEKLQQTLVQERVLNKKQNAILQERFAEGWEMYQKYRTLPSDIHDDFKYYFARPCFESFICGGADKSILDALWQETKECIKNERTTEAAILWDLFTYFLNLANLSYVEDRYAIVDANEEYNQEYDYSRHQPDVNSISQGVVDEIIIPGYTYNGVFEHKSIVNLREE